MPAGGAAHRAADVSLCTILRKSLRATYRVSGPARGRREQCGRVYKLRGWGWGWGWLELADAWTMSKIPSHG